MQLSLEPGGWTECPLSVPSLAITGPGMLGCIPGFAFQPRLLDSELPPGKLLRMKSYRSTTSAEIVR